MYFLLKKLTRKNWDKCAPFLWWMSFRRIAFKQLNTQAVCFKSFSVYTIRVFGNYRELCTFGSALLQRNRNKMLTIATEAPKEKNAKI